MTEGLTSVILCRMVCEEVPVVGVDPGVTPSLRMFWGKGKMLPR